jgi:beta-1,4-N-acetylglucosaminyltransferase
VPFAIIGKLFFGTRVIFVESITRIQSPSMTGKIMYWLADKFYYQWESLRKYFPKGSYGEPLL